MIFGLGVAMAAISVDVITAGLMAADWFGAMGRTWGNTPVEDQDLGGVILAGGSASVLVLGGWAVLRMQREQTI